MLSSKIVKHLIQLQEKKYRRQFHEFVIEGFKGVGEALSQSDVVLLVVEGSRREETEIAACITKAEELHVPVEFCGRKDIGDIKSTDTFPGILAVVDSCEYTLEDISTGAIIVLEDIKDPGNLGTIIRTADWFGIINILLSENSVDEYNPKVVRSTMGSMFRSKIYRSPNVLKDVEQLKKNFGYTTLGLDIKGKELPATILKPENKIFVFGSESHGISPELDSLIDTRYTIPGKGKAESLNLAISAGILMSRL